MSGESHWLGGLHAVTELLRQRPKTIQALHVQADRRDKRLAALRQLAAQAGIEVHETARDELERLVGPRHQGVGALLGSSQPALSEQDLPALLDGLNAPPLLLVLDGVTDPHNLGACLRSADAAGVDAVIVPKDKAVGLNATVRKVASGAAETVSFVTVTNLARSLETLKQRGIWLVGTDDQASTSLYEQDLSGALAIVMGSEGTGLRRLTRESCDFLVAIPMTGALSSLNVSVATGITLFEAVRQRHQSNSTSG